MIVGRPALAFLGAAAGALTAALVTWALSVHVASVGSLELRIMAGFIDVEGPAVWRAAHSLAHAITPVSFGLATLALGAYALWRRGTAIALATATLLLGSNVSGELLEKILSSPRERLPGHPISDSAWPSGHTTAVLSVMLAVTLVAARSQRPTIAGLGGILAAIVGDAMLLLGWHYPSDVIGAALVCAVWLLAVAGALLVWGGGTAAAATPRLRDAAPPWRLVALITAAAPTAVVVLRPGYALDNSVFVVALATITALLAGTVVAGGRLFDTIRTGRA